MNDITSEAIILNKLTETQKRRYKWYGIRDYLTI